MRSANGSVRLAGGKTLESIALSIEGLVGIRVADRTGLQGIYEYDLEFDNRLVTSAGPAGQRDPTGTSLFTALEDQLGLKLERRRETLDVLVIDSVEMPTEN